MKTIGDEVMIVSPDPVTLTEWAVGFLALFRERPQPRVGIHYGRAVYRDGDYFGTEVNLTHRVVARALGGEVMVTTAVAEAIGDSDYLEFDPIGRVDLKGFPEPVELFVVVRALPTTSDRAPGAAGIRVRASYDHRVIKEDALDELAEAVRASGLIEPADRGRGDGLGRRRLGLRRRGLARVLGAESVHALARQLRASRGRRRRRGARPPPLRGAAHRPPRRAAEASARRQPPGAPRARPGTRPRPSGCASAPAPR